MEEKQVTRIAVLGLYRSGSTALAGAMHHLGVDMGAPFFENYYEPADLSRELRRWWNEPEMTPAIAAGTRVASLEKWMAKQEKKNNARWIGAKHPLLSLCGPEVLAAWGAGTKFIWSYRDLDQSIQSLARLGWWQGREDFVQRTLWHAAHEFFFAHQHLLVDYGNMLKDPRREIDRVIEYIGIRPTDEQVENARHSILPPNKAANRSAASGTP